MNKLALECEPYLLDLGFTKREMDEKMTWFSFFNTESDPEYNLEVMVSISDDNTQVDTIFTFKNGKDYHRRTVIWGWYAENLSDIKVLFEKQIYLKEFVIKTKKIRTQ